MDPDRDPVGDARALAADLFPHAVWALLSGSVITGRRTPGSDLDIVVLLPPGDPQAPHRDSRYARGWPVELFVHDEDSLARFLTSEFGQRKPHLHRMVADGIPLAGDPGAVQKQCAEVLLGGPPPLTDQEREHARYGLTDLLDDLAHVQDPGERVIIADTAWTQAAHHALAFADRWSGHGKWLLRELRDLDADLAARWLAAHADPEAVAAVARDVLDRMGGPLFDGYRVFAKKGQ